jgi:hypothetical protein
MARSGNQFADLEPTDEAPFGWIDDGNGNPRPKKRPGRQLKDQVPEPEDGSDLATDEPEELEQDLPPKRPSAYSEAVKSKSRTAKAKVTLAQRKDIQAKISIMVALPSAIVARRDPICGGALMGQVPDISEALAELVCDSADLVEFFTSSSGYMKWLKLATALQPVAEVAWQHHVSHKIGNEDKQGGGPQDAWDRYHAPAV